jgi:hypothetical protein
MERSPQALESLEAFQPFRARSADVPAPPAHALQSLEALQPLRAWPPDQTLHPFGARLPDVPAAPALTSSPSWALPPAWPRRACLPRSSHFAPLIPCTVELLGSRSGYRLKPSRTVSGRNTGIDTRTSGTKTSKRPCCRTDPDRAVPRKAVGRSTRKIPVGSSFRRLPRSDLANAAQWYDERAGLAARLPSDIASATKPEGLARRTRSLDKPGILLARPTPLSESHQKSSRRMAKHRQEIQGLTKTILAMRLLLLGESTLQDLPPITNSSFP